MVVVREAVAADREAARDLSARAERALRKVYRPSPELVRAGGAPASDWPGLVAECDGELVGTVSYQVQEDRLHLRALMVDPDHQRQGVARALIGRLSELARLLGVTRLSLYTVVQTGNVPIFERLGFTVVSVQPAEGLDPVVPEANVTEAYMERPAS